MFKEDEQENQLLVTESKPAVVAGTGAAAVKMTVRTVDPEPEPEPVAQTEAAEIVVNDVKVKTLRDMLYEQEPWMRNTPNSMHTPGIRRLMEARVNRTLATVADWMVSNVEGRFGDEMTLVVLLELAEAVREQIVWPEREAQR